MSIEWKSVVLDLKEVAGLGIVGYRTISEINCEMAAFWPTSADSVSASATISSTTRSAGSSRAFLRGLGGGACRRVQAAHVHQIVASDALARIELARYL